MFLGCQRVAPIILLSLLPILGCAREKLPEFGQVAGTVTAKGKPVKGVAITFMPDPSQSNELPYNASGQTDAQGKYQLRYSLKGHEGEGAALGWNRAIAVDTRYAGIPQGQPPPPRIFSPSYGSITNSPLKFEVKPGQNTFDIELK